MSTLINTFIYEYDIMNLNYKLKLYGERRQKLHAISNPILDGKGQFDGTASLLRKKAPAIIGQESG
jgi:hypothetical protein